MAFLLIPLTAWALSILVPAFGLSLFSPFCHQNPERTFGALPLCSRCFGLYFGFGLAGLFAPLVSFRFSRRFAIAALAASLALAVLSIFSPAHDGNYVRLILGLSVGAGIALLVKSILK
ncbi:MAG: DUF2085 domain-containing protein [candidate division Zixibacteria bacterium]|nr:DUF2085 domain-containing protein [candidate division Zixibacteria bacterium]MCI0596864.1 DUF2085 domain-containing protein [candidate division Zixibacteria bacterium]